MKKARSMRLLSFIPGKAQQIIGGYAVQVAQRDQMMNGQLVGSPLIAGIHGLRGAQNIRHLPLRQIGVFTQIPHDFAIVHADSSLIHFFLLYSVNIFTIDFSKYIYYNRNGMEEISNRREETGNMNKGKKLSRRDFLRAAGKASLGAAAVCAYPAAGTKPGQIKISETETNGKDQQPGLRITIKDHALIIEQP